MDFLGGTQSPSSSDGYTELELKSSSMPTSRAVKVEIGYEDEENLKTVAKESYPLPQNGSKSVLLHSCCAPCSGAMVEAMIDRGLNVTIFFYNFRIEYPIHHQPSYLCIHLLPSFLPPSPSYSCLKY